MTVTHDFQLLASWDTTDGWTGSADVTPTAVSEPRLEGSGAISIVKSGTSELWFYAEYSFPSPVDLNGKLLVFYLYLSPQATPKLQYFRIRLYDSAGNYLEWNYDHKLAGGGWRPVVVNVGSGTSGIDRGQVVSLRLIFYTPSSSNTFQEGDIVVDRLLAGTGFYILYVTDENPHTMDDVARVDAEDNLMLVQALSRHLYLVRGKIHVGDGENVGALKVEDAVVVCDTEDLQTWSDGNIYVHENSYLILDRGLIIGAERKTYPYGSAAVVIAGGILRVSGGYLLTNLPLMAGTVHRMNISAREMVLEDFLTNYMLWIYGSLANTTLSGLVALLPYSSWVFDDYAVNGMDITATLYVFENSELVPRQSKDLRFHSTVFAGGQFRTDGSVGALYNPVNFSRDNLAVSGVNSHAMVYYDVDVYVADRLGNPLVGVTVKVYNYKGDEVAEAETDSNGHAGFRLLVYEKQTDSSGNLVVDEDYNPFTLEVYTSDGGLLARTRMEVRSRLTYYVTPEDVYAVTVWPGKPRVEAGEPIELYVEVRKADGSPVSGLDAYVDVETPDHTVYTVSLSEDPERPGLYRGEFTETSQVGAYRLTGYVVIGGVRMEARNQFEAGTLEARIEEVRDLLKKHDAKLDAYRWTL